MTEACLLCGARAHSVAHVYAAPPAGEVRFRALEGVPYRRELRRCAGCGHFVSQHHYDLGAIYGGGYVDATYGDEDGLRRRFELIQALPPDRSDNTGRVARVLQFADEHMGRASSGAPPRTILDVGSGLCVFLHRMKQVGGWEGTALDPDPRAARHAERVAGVRAVAADFLSVAGLGRFDVVALNKVLEHVPDPVAMLRRAAAFVRSQGFVYIELPDGEEAIAEGPEREEFFIDHHHVFSFASAALLARRAGFVARAVERLREPSTKFTIRAFLVPLLAQSGGNGQEAVP